jgi:hypothetical protein
MVEQTLLSPVTSNGKEVFLWPKCIFKMQAEQWNEILSIKYSVLPKANRKALQGFMIAFLG